VSRNEGEIKTKRQLRAEQADADLDFIHSIDFSGRIDTTADKTKDKGPFRAIAQAELENM
jgi:hypothetical protein